MGIAPRRNRVIVSGTIYIRKLIVMIGITYKRMFPVEPIS